MRRYLVAIDDQAFTIDVAETASDAFEVTVGGRTYEARLQGDHDLPGIAISPMVAAQGPHLEPSFASPAARPANPPSPAIPAAPVARQPDGPTPRPVSGSRPGAAAGGLVVAPMPGVILEIHVTTGDPVRRGDPLLVLEAMKMRNTIRAPRDGVVGDGAVEAGGHVASGDRLVRIGDPVG
jgi:biotin carboxyl carrier protein